MKKLAISIAVATIVAAPIAQAGSSLTGSIRYGLNYSDAGYAYDVDDNGADIIVDPDAQTNLENFGSRIKMSGDAEIGSGLTGYGNLELRLDDSRNGAVVNRFYNVGVKGGFGDLSFGVQDTAFDIANPDRTWWNGGFGLAGKRDEKNGALLYSKSFGDVELRAGAQMASNARGKEEVADIFDIGVKYAGNNITVAAAMQSDTASEGTAMAISGGYNFGAGDFTVTYGVEDEKFSGKFADDHAIKPLRGKALGEATGINVQVGVGDFYGWYGQAEYDGGNHNGTPSNIGVGYTQSLGDQTTVWYELFQADNDFGDLEASTGFNAVLKVDF